MTLTLVTASRIDAVEFVVVASAVVPVRVTPGRPPGRRRNNWRHAFNTAPNLTKPSTFQLSKRHF